MTTNTAQTLKAEIDTHIKNLAKLTTEAARSAAMKKYLEVCTRFYRYSPTNQLLIALERPDATQVAGFNAWKKFNRFVRRGEKGIPILAPCIVKDDETEDKKLVGFRVVYVFDVSQTNGEPLPPPPNWKSPERNEELQERLVEFAISRGIQVETKVLRGEIQGTSAGGKIELSPEAGTKTLLHELAHELLHHSAEGQSISREDKELEAESVAYVVSSHFGLTGLASPNYLALWDADESKILGRMDRIRAAATVITQAIEPKEVID